MIKKINRNEVRKSRHTRVRNKIVGTTSIPRLNVFRSNSNIFEIGRASCRERV